MAWAGEQLGGRRAFDLAGIHHRHAMADDARHDAEIVG